MEPDEHKKIEATGLKLCEVHDECNFCNEPQKGSYARLTGYDSEEIAYYICGKCALEKIKAGVQRCEEIEPDK